jgi:adenylate cyclase
MENAVVRESRHRGWSFIVMIVVLLAGLPVAVWLDLRNLSLDSLARQAADLNSMITSMRGYYATAVVGRVLDAQAMAPSAGVPLSRTQVVHNYTTVPGAIPIPATLSLELGRVISEQQANITYRFISDYPFKNRAPHEMDKFERYALAYLRGHPDQRVSDNSWTLLKETVRLVAPVIMAAPCVSCHNSHPESVKRDWEVGDVRGIQEVTVNQAIAPNIWAFKYLLGYFMLTALIGFRFISLQRRQAAVVVAMNRELTQNNEFLAGVSLKISRYLSPQLYKSIFSGEKEVAIHTERKKLTIFFSDIKDFTATAEQLQPEEITQLLNEYLTEMSAIAERHGGTIDKFIGDAILIFFGDPETRGAVEDACACVRMAIEMQHRIAELNAFWRSRGIEKPFRVRMGINTGYCNVGNFGSADRMEYTIIGSEANLAARLQSIAEPGRVVLSYETYALVRNVVTARPLGPVVLKGIHRETVPYLVEGIIEEDLRAANLFSEHMTGLDFYLDPNAVDGPTAARIRTILQDAVDALQKRELAGPTAT